MRKRLTLLLWTLLAAAFVYGEAEYYRVTVTRIDDDLYQDVDSKLYIRTEYCYEYAHREDAILKFEPYSYENKLIFEDGEVCRVKGVFR